MSRCAMMSRARAKSRASDATSRRATEAEHALGLARDFSEAPIAPRPLLTMVSHEIERR